MDVNAEFANMLGISTEEILEKRVSEILTKVKTDKFDWIKLYYLKQMVKSGKNLLEMINEVLDYVQLEPGAAYHQATGLHDK